MTTPKAIADWMLEELKQETILCQEVVAPEISLLFGEEFTYTNANGDLAMVISEYTQGDFQETWSNNEEWKGPIQTFSTRAKTLQT